MLNPFSVLRAMAKAAVVGGVQDALAEVVPDIEPVADLDELRQRITSSTAVAALTAAPAEDETTTKPRRKS